VGVPVLCAVLPVYPTQLLPTVTDQIYQCETNLSMILTRSPFHSLLLETSRFRVHQRRYRRCLVCSLSVHHPPFTRP
jgi:hypothetical protein